jgi:type IV pilus assembly protein PilW
VLLIELMIGISIGLLIAAAAVTFVAGHLNDNRRLPARKPPDAGPAHGCRHRRARLRRAGYWAFASEGIALAGQTPVASNPYAALTPSAAASDSVTFAYSRDATENGLVDSTEQFGFRLRNGALEIQLGAGNWQALTTPARCLSPRFGSRRPCSRSQLGDACAAACPLGSATCPPRLHVRSLAVEISGRAPRRCCRRAHGSQQRAAARRLDVGRVFDLTSRRTGEIERSQVSAFVDTHRDRPRTR